MDQRVLIGIEIVEAIAIALLLYYIVKQMKIPEEGEL